jgi:hypothetical protein
MKRRVQRAIAASQAREHGTHTNASDIVRIFSDYLGNKYSPIPVDDDCIRTMVEAGHRRLPEGWRDTMEAPFTFEELQAAVFKGESKKSLGRDGIGLEFFKAVWEEVEGDMRLLFNHMFGDRHLSRQQKQGVIVCVPKNGRPRIPEDYRPIALLNTDYKILARLIAARLRPILADLLHSSQHCGVPGISIFDGVATIRDVIPHTETEQRPLCVVSLDFKEAFDRISHTYILSVLRSYGFSERFIASIRMMYEDATSAVQVKGHLSAPIPIQCGVRQGCPLSMILFALCLDPLLRYLVGRLRGLRVHRSQTNSTVVAYADDVSILLTSPEDVPTIREAITCYEKATGAALNVAKSRALAASS